MCHHGCHQCANLISCRACAADPLPLLWQFAIQMIAFRAECSVAKACAGTWIVGSWLCREAVGPALGAQHHGAGEPCEGHPQHGLLAQRLPDVRRHDCTARLPVCLQCLQQLHVQLLPCSCGAGGVLRRVTGSEDHTARVWDLRKRKSLYTLAAHSSLVSQAWPGPLPPDACFQWTEQL